jgi:hypothetical protein
MKFLLFLSCIAVSIVTARTTVESETASRITSLLLDLRIDEAKAELDAGSSHIDTAAVREYKELFERLSPAAIPADTVQLQAVGAMAVQMGDRFIIPAAGRSANSAYVKCIEAYRRDDFRSSVLYYRLALFFKSRYYVDERFRLRAAYTAVRKTVADGNYEGAQVFIDSVIAAESLNPTFGEMKDSLRNLRTVITETIREINAERRKYSSQEIFGYTFGIAVAVSPIYTTSMHNVPWTLKTTGDGVQFLANVGAVHPAYGYTASVQFRYHYSPVLSQLLRLEQGGVTFTAVDMDGQRATIALKHTVTTYSTLIRYYLSETTGLRSFLSAGAGRFMLKRDEQRIYIADFLIGASRIKNYSLLAEQMSATKLTGEWGLEYTTGSLSRFSLEGTIGVHYLTSSQKLISPLFMTIQLTTGVLL